MEGKEYLYGWQVIVVWGKRKDFLGRKKKNDGRQRTPARLQVNRYPSPATDELEFNYKKNRVGLIIRSPK